jgi:NAD(P)-dependent dehydrogenase (short-subunit alcohol dehydrogenase family)
MTRSMDGRVALVTGSGAGIGRASAKTFSTEGAKVVVADVDVSAGEETVNMIKQLGGKAIFIKADISDANEVESLISQIVGVYGQLDYAHNNAGIFGEASRIHRYSEDQWDTVMRINLKGVWLCMKYEILQMREQQSGGSIVNTASAAGLVGVEGRSAYSASKHGVVGLTKTAALEYATIGIRVNAVCPGIIRTAMTTEFQADPETEAKMINQLHPIGRLGNPEEIAEAVVWLCSDKASFITGHAMSIDGGWTAR